MLVHIFRRFNDVLLAGRLALPDLHRLKRMPERVGKLLDAFGIIPPAEHLVDHLHVAEQVRKHPVIGLALHVVEQDRAAAVHVLLQARDFEVGVDGFFSLDQVALPTQPVQHAAQVEGAMLFGRSELFLAHWLLHCRQPRYLYSLRS